MDELNKENGNINGDTPETTAETTPETTAETTPETIPETTAETNESADPYGGIEKEYFEAPLQLMAVLLLKVYQGHNQSHHFHLAHQELNLMHQ